jgi:protocatechuate 3,4-dioxygenase beta subunit
MKPRLSRGSPGLKFRRSMAIRFVAAVGCCVPLLASAQQRPARDAGTPPPIGTASLAGTLVAAAGDERPVRRALVRLSTPDNPVGSLQVMTDDAGAFTFVRLPAGRYMLTASKAGMVNAAFGAKRPDRPGSAIQIADGEQVGGVRLRMLPGAVISGTVRDPAGQPVARARVYVMRYGFAWQSGERELQQVGSVGLGEETDDRGEYRVYGLPPGEFVVVVLATPMGPRGGTAVHQTTAAEIQWATRQRSSAGATTGAPATTAVPATGPDVDYAPIFYPGTAVQTSATPIALSAGQERADVDVVLQMVSTSMLECTVASAAGPVPANLQVTLIAHDRLGGIPFAGFSSTPLQRDGKYIFSGLLPGDYSVMVRVRPTPAGRGAPPPDPAAPDLFAVERVHVSGGDTRASVTLRPGATVSGRIVLDGGAEPPADLTRARVTLAPDLTGGGAVLGVPAATVDKNGAFTFRGVTPGRYRVTASLGGIGAAWQPRRVEAGGVDALDVPFEVRSDDVSGVVVTFTDRPSELSGTIQDAQGHPATEFFVIVFSRNPAHWSPQSRRIRSARPDNDGRYVFANLPPGDYALAAVTDVESNEWFDPAFLKQLQPASIAITIGEGEKKVQHIRTQGGTGGK